jgi:hypothetical protein
VVRVSVVPSTGWRIVVSSVVVVVVLVLCTAGSCLSSTVVQAENERKAAVARQERISIFMIRSLFGLLVGGGRGFLFFGVRRNWQFDEGHAAVPSLRGALPFVVRR